MTDVQGNLVKSEDSQSKAVTYIYEGFNNPLEMRDSLGQVTPMSYDQRGNKTRLDDPDTHVTTYTYNALGELLSTTGIGLEALAGKLPAKISSQSQLLAV